MPAEGREGPMINPLNLIGITKRVTASRKGREKERCQHFFRGVKGNVVVKIDWRFGQKG